MRVSNLPYVFMLLAIGLFVFPNNTFAQSEKKTKKEVKKKVVIIKKTIDKDGNEKVEKTIKEYSGDEEIDVEKIVEKNIKKGDNVEVEVEVTVDDSDGDKKKVKKKSKDKVIVVEVDGEDVKINDEGEVMIIEMEDGEHRKEIKTSDGKEIIIINKSGGDTEDVRILLDEMDGEGLDEDHDKKVRIFKMNEEVQDRAFFGVMINPSEEGMTLLDVVEGSPAEKSGLKKGDVLKSINGKEVNSYEELTEELGKYKPEDEIDVVYLRGGKTTAVKSKLSQGNGMKKKMIWKTEDGEVHEIDGDSEFHFKEEGKEGKHQKGEGKEHKKMKKVKKIKSVKKAEEHQEKKGN